MIRRDLIKRVEQRVDELTPEILSVSHAISGNPELAFQEFQSAQILENIVKAYDFTAVRGTGELQTAIRAEHKPRSDALSIEFISGFGALPNSHACGRNLIAASGVWTVIVFDELVHQCDLPANSIFLGTPVEEGGDGKIKMLDAGMFDDIDYVMMIHPCDSTMAEDWSLAGQTITFRLHGRSAHCAVSPWLGTNALAAATETVNMVNAWRSQFRDYSRVFPNITHGGGATNVIPDFAELEYNVRSDDAIYHQELVAIVENCAECATKALGVTAESGKTFAYEPVYNDKTLEKHMAVAFTHLGETVIPRYRDHGIGSTDMGSITQRLPAIHRHLFLAKENTHTTAFRKAAGNAPGDTYVIKAVKAMVLTAIGLIADQQVLNSMQQPRNIPSVLFADAVRQHVI